MKFTVAFSPRAEQQLTEIWLRASAREKITDAANRIEELLRHNADRRGESRPNDCRILIVGELVATFEVNMDDRCATVLTIRHNASRRQRSRWRRITSTVQA